MRRRAVSVEDVKRNITQLKGRSVYVAVNRGRKKIERFCGEVVDIFPSVFTFRATAGELVSFSYSDVICGDIKFSKLAD